MKSQNRLIIVGIASLDCASKIAVPLMLNSIAAGFPSPADDYIEKKLDLNEYLIHHPAATFFVRVEGNSMQGAGISTGDILIVDRAVEITNNKIAVVVLNGEFTVKRIQKKDGTLYLLPENEDYKPMKVTDDMDIEVWGVVTYVIHQVR